MSWNVSAGRLSRERLAMTLETATHFFALQSFTYASCFNQSLDNATPVSAVRSLTSVTRSNQSLDNVTPVSAVQSLTFATCFKDNVTLLQIL
jgi:hypothetical protein